MRKLCGLLLSSLCILCMGSCLDEEVKDRVVEVKLKVAAETIEENYMYPLSDKWLLGEFLNVQEDDSKEWNRMYLNQINGFSYQDGNEYLLKVKKTFLANPPADAPDITYDLIEITSQEKVNNEIVSVNRINIGEIFTVVRGDKLTEQEKQEIIEKIEQNIPKENYIVYKFIYTDAELPKGNVVVYMGNSKKEGTFERAKDNKKYTLNIEGKQTEYILSKAFTKSSVMELYAFIEDVTDKYKVDYPNLELAVIQQRIISGR